MKATKNLHSKSKKDLVLLIAEYEQRLQNRDAFITTLQAQLALAKQRHYGRKSEKHLDEGEQPDLFNEAALPENITEIEDADESITVPGYKRKKPGRKPLPKDLPRIQKIHDLPDEEKICHCGCLLTKIGEEKTEQLDIIPAKVQVIEHVKLKYACKTCEESIKTASAPAQPIPRSIASPGLIAYVLTAKYKDHLPLYRQENIFQRMGVDIARNTLSHWVIKAGELLLPLYTKLQENINDYDVAYADETRVQVLKEKDRPAQSGSYMWTFIGGSIDKRSIIYKYDPGRAHTVIEQALADFKGYLHCDGFVGYDSYAVDHETDLIGCWMHARRRFAEIVKTTQSTGLAYQAIKLIAKLYKVENHAKLNKYSPIKIYEYRKTHAQPILTQMNEWLHHNYTKVLPKSPIGEAIKYCLNQWPKLTRYLEDGRLEIDNGLAERVIKPFVIGRKNWLFSCSVAGVKAAEVIYSIIETCNAHDIEPYAYLRYVLAQLPMLTSDSALQDLLPYQIDKNTLKG